MTTPTPTFNFDLSDSDSGDTLRYQMEIDEASGDFSDPVLTVLETGPVDENSIAGGETHTLAIKPDGTVWAWGYNYYGQLGNGITSNSSSPVQVQNLTGAIAVSAGR